MFNRNIARLVLAFCLASTISVPAFAQPVVSSVSPSSQSITANVSSDITLNFVAGIDPATVTNQSFRVFGRWSGPATGTITFEDGNKRIRFNPTDNFFAGEWVTISLSNIVADAGASTMAGGYSWNFWTATATGTLNLTNIGSQSIRATGEGAITSYGAYAGDFNGDGFSDLVVPNENTNDVRMFLNNSGSFGAFSSAHSLAGAGRPSPNEGADFNNDGKLDLVVGVLSSNSVTVFIGDGLGSLGTGVAYTAGFDVRAVCIADYDADGDEDIIMAARNDDDIDVQKNDGSGVFSAGGSFATNANSSTACAVADANEDGIMDVFVGSYLSQELTIMLGDGDGGFTVSNSILSGGRNWMIAAGDVNGDGHADVVSAGGNTFPEFTVALGDGAGGFISSNSIAADNFIVAIDLGDVDGDGDLDLAVSSISNARWSLYENDGTGTYPIAPIRFDAPSQASCAIFHDRDNDGDLDMTTIDEGNDHLVFFDNDSSILSVELTDFDVLSIGYDLTLRWKTAMEVDNAGFDIESTQYDSDEWTSIGFVTGAGSTTSTQSYTFSLVDTEPGRYRFRLRQVDFDGRTSYSNEITVVLAAPEGITLTPAFPNPFASKAVFDVIVPRMVEVDVELFNALGQQIRTLHSGYLSGLDRHQFEVDGTGLPAGYYLIRVKSKDSVATTGLTLSK